MIIEKNRIVPNHPTEFSEEIVFDDAAFANSYPIKGIRECYVEGEISKRSASVLHVDIYSDGFLILEDTSTLKTFEREYRIETSTDILSEPDADGEGYIYEGKSFDMGDLLIKLIKCELPISIHEEEPLGKLDSEGEYEQSDDSHILRCDKDD